MFFPCPVVEITNNRDRPGIWRPDRKIGTLLPVVMGYPRAELIIKLIMPARLKKMDIKVRDQAEAFHRFYLRFFIGYLFCHHLRVSFRNMSHARYDHG